EGDAVSVTIAYELEADNFWVDRRLLVDGGKAIYDHLSYGKAAVPGGGIKSLELGKFDAPRLVSTGKGGIFAGVGWWFYDVENGLYQNNAMNFETEDPFTSEPWYLGVFQPEEGEPYPGWFWYRTFLVERKLEHDQQRTYAIWNAR